MSPSTFLVLITLMILPLVKTAEGPVCPDNCICSNVTSTDQTLGLHLECSGVSNTSFPQIIPNDVISVSWSDKLSSNVQFQHFFDSVSWQTVIRLRLRFETQRLEAESFRGLVGLQELAIHSQTLTDMHNLVFTELPDIQKLDLSWCSALSISSLSMAARGLPKQFRSFIGQGIGTKRVSFILDESFLSGFNNTHLEELNLAASNLRIVDVSLDCCVPHVKLLNLSNTNFITYSFTFARQLRIVDITGYSFPPNMFLHDDIPEKFTGPRRVIYSEILAAATEILLPNLEELYITRASFGSAVEIRHSSIYVGLNNLKVIRCNGIKGKILDLEFIGLGNLRLWDFSYDGLELITPDTIKNQVRLEEINLSHNNLYKMQHSLHFNLLFMYSLQLTIVDLSFNKLTFIPNDMFANNTKLRSLNLQHNLLHTLCITFTSNFKHIQSIDLSSNSLSEIDECFLDTLRSIRHGHVMTNTSEERQGFRMRLSGNVLSCQCDDSHFQSLIQEFNDVIEDTDQVICKRDSWSTGRVWKDQPKCTHDDSHNSKVFIIVGVVAGIVVLSIVTIAVFLKRAKLKKVRLHQKLRENATDPEFVAFVSYSSKDADFVLESFVPTLEVRLKEQLNIQDRDLILTDDRHFEVAKYITNNVIRAVSVSSVSIFMISQGYLDSKWCEFESRVADLEGKPVILVFLEKVSVKKSKFAKGLMKKWPYITWPEMSGGIEVGAGYMDEVSTIYDKLTNDLLKFCSSYGKPTVGEMSITNDPTPAPI